nr:hypothetical protein BaRGS_023903 [Batillaria attramentaria]
MGAYYIYALSRKDPNIGSLASVIFFIVACIISVGFKSFCDSFMKGQDMGAPIHRNRRLRSEGMFADSSPAGLGTKSEDLKNVAAAEPTA